MTPRSPSPPLVKGINGIVSRLSKKVNYSALNGKKTKAITPIEQELRMKYWKWKIVCNFVKIENKAKMSVRPKIWINQAIKTKIKTKRGKTR